MCHGHTGYFKLQVDVILALGDSVTAAFGVHGKKGGLVRTVELHICTKFLL